MKKITLHCTRLLVAFFFVASEFILPVTPTQAQCSLTGLTCDYTYANQNLCNLEKKVTALSGVTGGTAPYTIKWVYDCPTSMGAYPDSGEAMGVTSFPFTKDTVEFNNAGTGTYYVTVSDANGCTITSNIPINVVTCSYQSVTTGSTPPLLCLCRKFYLSFTSTGIFNGNNGYTVFLSDCNGDFMNKVNITDTLCQGTPALASTAHSGKIPVLIPCNLTICTSGSGYKLRIDGNSPPVTGTPTPTSFATEPSDTVDIKISGSKSNIFTGNPVNFIATTDSLSAEGNSSFQWMVNGSVVNSGTQDTLFTTTTLPNGIDTVKCIMNSSYGCAIPPLDTSNIVVVKVSNLPVGIQISVSPDSVVCTGTSATFTAVSQKPGSFQWQSSPNGISFSNISGATAAVYNTSIRNQTAYYRAMLQYNGATDSSNVQKLTVLLHPVAGTLQTEEDSFCNGNSGYILLTGHNGGTIQWQSSTVNENFKNINGANDSSYTTRPLLQTTYYRVIGGTGVCSDTSASLPMFVVSSPVASFTARTSGLQVAFNSDESTGVTYYAWDFGDNSPISNLANPTHTYDAQGVYAVCFTGGDKFECSYTMCRNISAFSTRIEGIGNDASWEVYPNPVHDEFFIKMGNSNAKIERIAIYDMTGREMLHEDAASYFSSNPLRVDVSALSQGVYYLKIVTGDMNYVQAVVKQ